MKETNIPVIPKESEKEMVHTAISAEQPVESAVRSEDQKKKSSPMGPVQTFFLNALIIVTAIWLLFGFVFGFFSAPNNDMSPNIKAGDLMLYYRLAHGYSAQDIIVLNKNKTTYVGRIVAKSGDTIDIRNVLSDHLKICLNSLILKIQSILKK